jgi:hypothetical protein
MSLVALAASAGLLTLGHAGLTFPIPRNNFQAQDPAEIVHPAANGTRLGGPCAGGECLWFNEGCFPGCEKCLEVREECKHAVGFGKNAGVRWGLECPRARAHACVYVCVRGEPLQLL